MWSRKRKPVEVEETEMTPRPDALEQAASRAMARLRGAPRLADVSRTLPDLPARVDVEDPDRAHGDDPMLWSRAMEPEAAPKPQPKPAETALRRIEAALSYLASCLTPFRRRA